MRPCRLCLRLIHGLIAPTLCLALLCGGLNARLCACDGVVVGKAASADGAVLVGHNEENALDRVLEFHRIPRQKHTVPSAVALDRGGRIEQVPETQGFLWSENPGLYFSDGYLNESGVAVASIQCLTREDGYDALVARGEIRDGGIGYMLRRLVALRAKTSREAMELMGSLVERFGYTDSGRTYVVADANEAWVVEVVRGRRWVAQRVPDDQVVVLPARHIIGEINLADRDNYRASPDLIPYAVARGWFDPQRGEPFNFRKAYQTAARLAPDGRQFRGQEIVTGQRGSWPPAGALPFAVKPHKKLSVRDVAAFLRDKGGIAPMFNATTQEAAVFQLRSNMPREIGCIYWRTTGRPDLSVLTPWYLGVTSTPDNYGRQAEPSRLLSLEHHFQPEPGTFDFDPDRAWWKFKTLIRVVDQDPARRAAAVQAAWATMEHRIFGQQAAIETEAVRLWPKDAAGVRTRLTRYCADLAAEACTQADKLRDVVRSGVTR